MGEIELKQRYLMQQTYATLFAVTNKLQVHGDRSFQKITSRQFMTLLAIAHIEGDASLSNIARKLGTTKQSVNQILCKLEKQNFVEIFPNQHDKRKVQVMVTSLGNNVLEESYDVGKDLLSTWFGNFTKDELEVFFVLLKKLFHFDGEAHDGFEKEIGKPYE